MHGELSDAIRHLSSPFKISLHLAPSVLGFHTSVRVPDLSIAERLGECLNWGCLSSRVIQLLWHIPSDSEKMVAGAGFEPAISSL